MRKKTAQDYKELANSRGFIWNGPEVSNTRIKTKWECPKSHVWEAPYSRISLGQGCPYCANRIPKTDDDYKKLAKTRNFVWIGPLPPNTLVKTNWGCVNGHQWEAPYSSILQGSGCPHCYGNVPIKKENYISLAKKRKFRWLGPMVLNTETKTQWECHLGHQWKATYHNIKQGSNCPECSKISTAKLRRKTHRDYLKLAKKRGIKWLGPEVSRNNIKTLWECANGHKWEADFSRIQQGSGCPHCYGNIRKKSQDYHILAKKNGIEWLGPEVPNTKTNTVWRCSQKHKWESPYTTINSGHGCPFCAGLSPKTDNDYIALAKDRGFKWLGPTTSNTKANTNWECLKGHQWSANYHNIQGGTGCPICVDMVYGQKVSKAQRKLSKILGGHLNFPFGRYNIDIALDVEGENIAIEYDAWYWHAHRLKEDESRDRILIKKGWKILRIKTNTQIPNLALIEKALQDIKSGKNRVEIILDDWGKGPTRF